MAKLPAIKYLWHGQNGHANNNSFKKKSKFFFSHPPDEGHVPMFI
jgi:hypothetical protein